MRKYWLPLHILIVLVSARLGATALPSSGQGGGTPPAIAGVTISYSFPSQHLTLHEPVILTFKISNGTPQPIRLDLGLDRKGGFSFTVTRPDGARVQVPAFYRTGLSRVGRVSVQSGESYSQDLLLNELYDFSMPGRYVLEGVLTNPISIGSGPVSEKDTGFRTVLDFAPRDELALTKACDVLANRIEAAPSNLEAADAAFALSYVKDPIAVPYLRRALLAQKVVESVAINGLESIGNDEAVRVLAEALGMKSGETALLARAALARIEMRTTDVQVRQEIDRVLQSQ